MKHLLKRELTWLPAMAVLLLLASLACGLGGAGGSAPSINVTVAPIVLGDDLTQVDLCAAVPTEAVEAAVGRKLVGSPERFELFDTPNSSGCAYDAGEDAAGNLYWGYVALAPVEAFDNQPRYMDKAVSGIGDAAYFNTGADARQLWVRIGDRASLVVAFGDAPNEQGAEALARLIVAALQ